MASSNAMEHRGLVRALDFLEEHSIEVGTLIADRHKQIARYMRETHPGIIHQYDVWHISKGDIYLLCLNHYQVVFIGIKKKLAHLSTNKECSIIGDWIKSITNHLY